jgi:hypothetical protein
MLKMKNLLSPNSRFKDIALGTGFGLRYDLSFFVIRFDFGFKTTILLMKSTKMV